MRLRLRTEPGQPNRRPTEAVKRSQEEDTAPAGGFADDCQYGQTTVVGVSAEHADEGSSAASVDAPVPLSRHQDVPSFPTETLPTAVRDMVGALSVHTQTDPAMAGMTAVTVLAACAGGRVVIEVREGWSEPLNLYTLTLAHPGERKSVVQARLTAPLRRVEDQLRREVEPARLEAETRKDVAKKVAEALKEKAVRADPDDRERLTEDALQAALEAEAIQVPAVPRLVADDITPEACASLLVEQGGRLAVVSAEGGLFETIAGRYSSNVPNLDVWLKAHNGDPVTVDRRSRPPEHIENPALTLALMGQPDVLSALSRQPAMLARGLVARFLFCLPAERVGTRRVDAPPVPPAVSERYSQLVEGLAHGLANANDVTVLTLSEPARQRLRRFEAEVEFRLGPDRELHHVAGWGAKLVGAVARLAGLLHLGDEGLDGLHEPVPLDVVDRAILLGGYLRASALRAFEVMGADPEVANAEYILKILRDRGVSTFSQRDLMTWASRSRFPKSKSLEAPLSLLVDHGYLIALESAGPTGGRRKSPAYRLNPTLLQ